MTRFSSLWCRFVLSVLLGLIIGQAAKSAGIPVTRIVVADTVAEFPNSPDFLILKLDVSAVLGRVQVFGDGRVSLLKYRNNQSWQQYELRLELREVEQIVKDIIKSGVLEYDRETAMAKLKISGNRPIPFASQSTTATLTIRLSKFEKPHGDATNDYVHFAKISDWDLVRRYQDFYNEAPEILALAEAIQRLIDLAARPDLRSVPIAPPDHSSPPSWAKATRESDSAPQILYFGTDPREIWEVDWLGGDRRQLAAEMDTGVSYSQPPSVSPDRDIIAYRSTGGLHLLNLTTGEVHKFIEEATQSHTAVWSPTGNWVAVSATIGEQRYHLVAVHADGSNPRVLTSIGAKPLQWSADGKRLYYQAFLDSGRSPHAFVMNRDGTEKRPALPLPSNALRVSPDGRMGAYLAAPDSSGKEPASGSSWLWTVKLRPSKGTASSRESPVRVAQEVYGYDWSPDSRFLVFTSARKLAVVRADGRESKILVNIEVGDQGVLHPNWSPDGRAIAFVKVASGGDTGLERSEIWVLGSDGSDPRRIADGFYPHWYSEASPPVWVPW